MLETATFGAGCFWGVEETFRKIPGVMETTAGYIGGDFDNPTYQDVCSGKTGHAEAVEVKFDPARVSYEDLLKVFFDCHNPTTLNRQGPDYGSQYRSAIFYHSDEQKEAAEKCKKMVAGRFKDPVVTEISSAKQFWRAKEYHQKYFLKNGGDMCHV